MAIKKTDKPKAPEPKASKTQIKKAPPKKVVAKKKPAPKKKAPAVMGRPTDYSPAVLEKAKKYLTEFDLLGHSVPSVAGLAVFLEVSRSTIYAWAKEADKADFSDMLESLLAKQEQIALARGLSGDFNSTIVKLLLCKHGYSDRTETQSTISFGDLSDDELNAKIKSLIS